MSYYADIAIYGQDGQPKLLVEVKNKRGTSPQWAARLRRNMYAHGRLPHVPYFLLALPDRFYLWRNVAETYEPVEPQYSADAQPLLRPYFERSGVSSDNVTENGLELAISTWLEKLARGYDRPVIPEAEEWLRTSGLLDAIKGGRVEVQAIV